MSKLTAPKGFEDILPQDSWKWQAIEQIARDTAALYHFHEIRTPVLEQTALFHRGVGETPRPPGALPSHAGQRDPAARTRSARVATSAR